MTHICFEVHSKEEFLYEIDQLLKKHLSSIKLGPQEVSLMTRHEVAEYFSVSLPTIHKWMHNGILPFYRIGNKIKFKRKEVIAALKPHRDIRRKN